MAEEKPKKVISTANDENDDWLKKIDDGKWQKQDLKAHEEALKRHKRRKRKK